MKDYIRQRVKAVGNYIYETKATVRQAARIYGVSKSTVHKDVTERLLKIDPELASRVKKVLEYNKAERHIRGGEATKRKYKNMDEDGK
ncbi:MAG: sporulation transcriptional regulator SpoIIID [Bacillota bacterium]